VIGETSNSRQTLSRVQITLFVLVAAFAVVTEAVVLRAYVTSGNATSAVEDRSFVTTGLANVQRESLLLHIETNKVLRDPSMDPDRVELRRALLGNQMRLQAAQVIGNKNVSERLAQIEQTLDGYDALLKNRLASVELPTAEEAEQFGASLATLESQVKSLYDDEEQRFFQALSSTLRSNQTLQIFLLALSGLVLVSGGVLGLSLRRTVQALRSEMGERDKVEGHLRDANDQIVRSEKLAAIGQMSGGVAHDLRNPLGAIKNAVYMLKKRLTADGIIDENPKMQKYLEIIDQQIARSNRIITDLMSFARVSAPTLTSTRLDEVIEESLATMDKNENITLSTFVDQNLHPVMADGEQLQRVFLNLANNAQDAMIDGGKLIINAVSVNNHVEISFSDTGSGITDENIQRIFDPLFTTKTKGTGLGLAVCQEIVMRHGGSIEVTRNDGPDGGSTFAVKLPAATE